MLSAGRGSAPTLFRADQFRRVVPCGRNERKAGAKRTSSFEVLPSTLRAMPRDSMRSPLSVSHWLTTSRGPGPTFETRRPGRDDERSRDETGWPRRPVDGDLVRGCRPRNGLQSTTHPGRWSAPRWGAGSWNGCVCVPGP